MTASYLHGERGVYADRQGPAHRVAVGVLSRDLDRVAAGRICVVGERGLLLALAEGEVGARGARSVAEVPVNRPVEWRRVRVRRLVDRLEPNGERSVAA